MTDQNQGYGPEQPYPHPQQPHPNPYGEQLPIGQQFAGPATAGGPPVLSLRNPAIIIAAAVFAVILLAAGGVAVYVGLKEDSGVAACKAMRDSAADKNAQDKSKTGSDDTMTKEEYDKVREMFADSRHDDIREHGTALVDVLWEVSKLPKGQEMGVLAYMGPLSTHMMGLKTACANQGVMVEFNDVK